MLYLLNSPILTAYGLWQFRPLSEKEAQQLAAQGFISAIGHEASALLLSQRLQQSVATQRISVTMEPQDQAIVLRLTTRLPEGKVLSAEELAVIPCELGLLERLE